MEGKREAFGKVHCVLAALPLSSIDPVHEQLLTLCKVILNFHVYFCCTFYMIRSTGIMFRICSKVGTCTLMVTNLVYENYIDSRAYPTTSFN
jgi:hypothetical protein